MNIEEFDKLTNLVKSIKQQINEDWVIDNISLQYFSQGQINIRLIRKKEFDLSPNAKSKEQMDYENGEVKDYR